MVVITARGDESRLISKALHQLEAEDSAIEIE